MLIDSHCHLDFPGLAENLPEVIARAAEAGVERMVTISTRIAQAERYRAIAERFPQVMFTVGTHPHNAAEEPDIPAADIVALSRHPRCVAIGEAGLDFHYDRAPRDVQERVFRTHIAAAKAARLPLVIHAREADEAMIRILEEDAAGTGRDSDRDIDRDGDRDRPGRLRAVLHCFSSGTDLARAGVALGLFFSFSGILTFKGSTELRRIAGEIVPPDRLLVETDAPYLAPVPHRGRPNEPAYVAHTARVLAETVGLTPEALADLTTANFLRLFTKARPLVAVRGSLAA